MIIGEIRPCCKGFQDPVVAWVNKVPDLSNWLIGTAIKVSHGFKSQAESFSRKTLETLGTLVWVWV